MIYMDYNATCPLRKEALAAMMESYEVVGNPSSIHQFGRQKRALLESARAHLAIQLGTTPETLIFTSGGSEANALAITGSRSQTAYLVTSTIEHDSVLVHGTKTLTTEGPHHRLVRTTAEGVIDLSHLEEVLATTPSPALVSIMFANNETGVIQPIKEAARLAHAAGALIHTDATQALGRMPVCFEDLGIDMMTVSSHKVGGPLGTGALIVRPSLKLSPQILGGLQERGLRAGTENTPGIMGFAAAVEAASSDDIAQISQMRDALESTLKAHVPDLKIYGEQASRLGNTSCFSTPLLTQESQLMALDLVGIGVSAGAACASKKMRASHVLMAMGSTLDEAKCALRVSLGYRTTPSDIEALTTTWLTLYARAHNRIYDKPLTTRTATC
jgi:cysteine desulfurase